MSPSNDLANHSAKKAVVNQGRADDADPSGGSTEYLSSHLQNTRTPGHYDRNRYAVQGWQTYGSHLPADRKAVILSIGPGECEFEEYLRDTQGYESIEVVDRASDVIAYAQNLGLTSHFADDLVAFLHDRPSHYDVVILLHVLEHVPKSDTIDTLSAIRSALKPGAALCVEVPNMGDPFSGLYSRYADFTHEVGFTEESLRYVLTKAGFDSVEFLSPRTAPQPIVRRAQRAARSAMRMLLMAVSLPNGRQMKRRIDPVLAVVARAQADPRQD